MAKHCEPESHYDLDPATAGEFGTGFPTWVIPLKKCTIHCTYGNEKIAIYDEEFETHKLIYVLTIMDQDFSDFFELNAFSCRVKVTVEECIVNLIYNERPNPEQITTLLLDKLKDIHDFSINLNAQNGSNFRSKLHNRLATPKEICDKKAIVLRHDMTLYCVAGMMNNLDNLLTEMNYNEEDVADLANCHINLAALDIESFKHPYVESIKINDQEQKCNIIWRGRIRERWEDLLKKFLNSCQRYEVHFDEEIAFKSYKEEAQKVIFNPDGTMNMSYIGHLTMKHNLKDRKCDLFALTKENGAIILYGQGENVLLLKTGIENSMCRLEPTYTFFLSNKVACLQKRGGTQLSRLKEELEIDFQINDRSITLYIEEGRSNLTKDVSDSILKLIVCTKVDTPLIGLDFAKVERMMDDNQCLWELISEAETKYTGSDECSLVWLDPYRATKLSLLQADKCTPYADIWIELTTDQLQPLGLHPKSQDHRLLSGRSRKTDNKRVGDTEALYGPFSTSSVLTGCRMVLAVVVQVDLDGTGSDVIENKTLRGVFVNALEKSRHVHRHICLNAGVAYNDPELALLDVISQFIKAIKIVSGGTRPSFTQNVSIIVDKDKLEIAKGRIENQMTTSFRVFDKPNVSQNQTRSERKLKQKVTVGTITHSTRDVIVNTTNEDLDFSQGFVSSEISRLAGNGLEEECQKFYPDGIDEGIVAFTHAHELKAQKIRHIFHCALPEYNYKTLEKDVKQTVKSCLYLAEELGCKTIAFPALGVGNKRYPRRETASSIMDAVNEFSETVEFKNLKEVDLVCFGKDTKTRKAFESESWRRSKKLKDSARKGLFTLSDQTVGTRKLDSAILAIAVQDTSLELPSFAVQVKFDKDLKHPVLKPAMDHHMTWNDELYYNEIECFKDSSLILKLGDFLDSERITFLVWNIDMKSKLPCSDQMELISDVMERMLSEREAVYLQKAVILVPDKSAVTSFREKEKSKKDSSWTWGGCMNASIRIFSPSQTLALKAKEHLEKMIEKAKESDMRTQGPRADADDSHEGTNCTLHGKEKEDNNSQELTKIIPAVSATINPGIMRFIGNDFNRWKDMFERTFLVEITETSDGITTVQGTYKAVEDLEEYLSKDFPSERNLMEGVFV
ncbi:uncharacterized protein LOC128211436 isoform X2 [Mya arenaria]|uniref:uncharacterized protein LOC128211436 isoform X2 n=1 Tax=Mya arenaria TaxID=6604 RepID=UPI0022E71039|nr:uncharacterized protein LOC128211436 isoform X2 [Mya arenaria]